MATTPNPLTDTQVYDVPVDALLPYPGNPRIGDLGAIAESLEANGQYRPIVVRQETRHILAGNHTWQAAKHLGWTSIKVTYLTGLTDEQAARIVLADNRLPDLGRYNVPDLTHLLEQVGGKLEGTGYDNYFLTNLLASLNAPDSSPLPTDTTPSPQVEPTDTPPDMTGPGTCPACRRPLEV